MYKHVSSASVLVALELRNVVIVHRLTRPDVGVLKKSIKVDSEGML